jgi:uncharacterized membrane protein
LGIAGFRWLHLLAGIAWIGLLYYFNFVQTPSLAQFEAPSRTEVQRKLLPRALLWFRMAAAFTFVTGILIFILQEQYKTDFMKSWAALSINSGMLIAIVMLANVWAVIWPNQQVVIANAEGVAAGKDPDPAAAPAGRKAALASRTNTLFSIPVMWFMIGTSHWTELAPRFLSNPSGASRGIWYLLLLVFIVAFELNALGVIGGYAPSPTRKFLDSAGQTIAVGCIAWFFFLFLQLAMS